MRRLVIPVLVVLALPACAISPPSLLGTFSEPEETKQPSRAERQARPRDQTQADDSASLSSTIGGLWDEVTSGIGRQFSGSDKPGPKLRRTGLAPGTPETLDAAAAERAVNAYRREKGLQPVTLHPQLAQAALAHAEDLAKNDRISHYGSDGSDAWDRVLRSGYPARLAAENVGTGQLSIEEVFIGWKESPTHNANMLIADAEHIGVAMVHRPDTQFKTFWTLVIGAAEGT